MAKILLIRHAQSKANSEGIYQGQSYDTDLSDVGQMQTHLLAEYLESVPVDRVISSPLKRTMQTAIQIATKHNIEVEIDNRIMETNHGVWEGKKTDEIKEEFSELWKEWLDKPGDIIFPKGEKFSDTTRRAIEWWKEISQDHGVIVAVTHENIIQAILAYIQNVNMDRIWDYKIQNTSITEIERDSPPFIRKIGNIDHINKRRIII
jgi:phosphoserine phosphatase